MKHPLPSKAKTHICNTYKAHWLGSQHPRALHSLLGTRSQTTKTFCPSL